ncbi:hypothetical protein BH11PAT1_BH11PAT1_1340 [soil metagenome]
MNISVIIPNYNGAEIIRKNLPIVLDIFEQYKSKYKNEVEVIIVDDGSTDTSREILADMFGNYTKSVAVRFLFNHKNFGFSTTVNKGVAAAKGEIVILLNTDVVPEKGFIEPLLTHFTDEKVFGVGCMDKSIENGKTVLRGRGIGRWENGLLVHSAGDLGKTNTLWVSGGSGAFRTSLWEKLGGLSEIMNPFYGEDIDLGYRALKSGYTLLFEKESVVTHLHEEGSIKTTQSAKNILATTYRNQQLITFMNVTDTTIIFSYLLFSPKRLLHAIRERKKGYLSGLLQAYGLFFQTLSYRYRNKKLFTHTDQEIERQIVI